MEVILKQDITGLGYKNDIVKVKNGYGRNYLIPNGIAMVANNSSKKEVEEVVKQQSLKMAKIKAEAEKKAKKIESFDLKVHVKVGKNDKIYGSVTTAQILEELKKIDITVDKKLISMDDSIKKLGKYKAKIELHRDVKTELNFEVVSE